MLGVGIPRKALESQQSALVGSFGFGFLVMFLGWLFVGLFFARAFTSSVHSLKNAVQGIAAGDLSTSIGLGTKDELGDLAKQLEHMRAQLREAITTTSYLQSHHATVLQALQVPIVTTDRDNRIAFVNRAAEVVLGQTRTELIGQHWLQVFLMDPDADGTIPLSWNRSNQEIGSESLVVRGRLPVRTRPAMILDVVSSPIHVQDQPSGFLHLLRDMSNEEKLAQTKEDFVLNVAHELRGPLASLRVSIDLLTEEHATMSKHDLGVMLRTLQKVIWRFQGLAESLIDVGNIQAGRFRVHPAPVSLEKLIRNATEQTQSMWETKGQWLETKLQAESTLVLADPSRITQVLVNLLVNANKYGPDNSPVVLSACQDEQFVYIGVTDQGMGIPPEEQTLVFERFFRAKRTEEEGAGVGLGLALAKAIVAAHGGQIRLKSGSGDGTTFWFSLPQLRPTEPEALPADTLDL